MGAIKLSDDSTADAAPYSVRDALTFRRFVLEAREKRAVAGTALAEDTAEDFLQLSLKSTRQLLRPTFKLKRADGKSFRFYPGYVDTLAPNAFAGECDGLHLIGLNIGLGAAFHEFSLFCFAQPSAFADLGNAAAEREYQPLQGYAPGFWFNEVGAALGTDAFVDRAIDMLPRDPGRQVLATLLTALMMRFAWFHELYHCLRGHLALVRTSTTAFCLDESPMDELSALPTATRHALEFHADQSAFWMQCQFQREDRENIEGLLQLPIRQRLRLAIFASYATTWIMSENARRLERKEDHGNHPSPDDRLWNMLRVAASNVIPLGANEQSAHEVALADLENISGQLKDFPGGKTLTERTRDPALQGRLDAFADDVVNLREQLRASAYI